MTYDAARELDRLGYGDSCMHRLDSRAKLVVALVFILCVTSFPKYTVSSLIPFFLVPLAFVTLGNVPARPILRLILIASPFAIVVGLFNPFLDRSPMGSIAGICITGGMLSFASILLRFTLSLGIVLALIATTSLPGLLHGLVRMGVPRAFAAQVQMLYRYLFLLVEEGRQLHWARLLRDSKHRFASPRLAKSMLASLLWRTWERAERIYESMKVRGFTGDFPSLQRHSFSVSDAIFVTGVSAMCVFARVFSIPQWIGALMMNGAS